MREVVFLVVLAVLFCLVVVAVNVVNALTGTRRPGKKPRSQTTNLILAPIRKRFGAENLRASRLGELNVFRPALMFDYGRTMAKLKHFGSPWRRRRTQKTVLETDFLSLPNGKFVRVISRDEDKRRDFDRMETEDEEFDREFFVYTNQPSLAKRLLTDAVRWKMIEIKNLQQAEIQFELDKGKLNTSSNQWFQSGAELLDFVQGGLELFDQLMLHNADGVEFLKENQAAVMEDFRCPICSDDVMHDMVVCKRCKTPHCAECWEYNGKCATFACMEERCVRVEAEEV